ncbi:hypothetical protein ACQPX6_11445 [Actinomycetospora sp. CA-101289]|uniref:hypothetical protein n=1 Tax=Actinomycetospora sp. CA-101289 TaxID=3239893 RepID=UPI003D9982B5
MAMDLFFRSVMTDAERDGIAPGLLARLLTNGEVFFGGELALVAGYEPDPGRLRATGVEVTVAVGRDHPERYLVRGAVWLADQLGVELRAVSGAHVPGLDRPTVLAEELRALLDAPGSSASGRDHGTVRTMAERVRGS